MRISRGTLLALLFFCFITIGIGFVTPAGGISENHTGTPHFPSNNVSEEHVDKNESLVIRFSSDEDTVTSTSDLKSQATNTQSDLIEEANRTPYLDVTRTFWIANAVLVEYDPEYVSKEDFENISGVDHTHPNFNVTSSTDQTDYYSADIDRSDHQNSRIPASNTNISRATMGSQQDVDFVTYGLDMIRAPQTWTAYNTAGEDAGVAVLDTGVDDDHEAIDVEGWAEFDRTGDSVQSDPTDPDGHGTHVAGTVTGNPVDRTAIGVAPDADLHGVRVLDEEGRGSFAQVLAGMEWAIERDDEIDIIQLSLGVTGYEEGFIEPVENARDAGQIVSAAIGNAGQGVSSSPGNIPQVVSTGAVTSWGAVPFFSSGEIVTTESAWGEAARDDWPTEYTTPDVAAPGVFVQSAEAGTTDALTSKSGTSMASPHTAGAAALAISAADGNIDNHLIQDAIVETAVHPGGPNAEDTLYGQGIIDSLETTNELLADASITGTVTIDGEPATDATVQSSIGGSTRSGEDGSYTLSVPDGEQTITADSFGWQPKSSEISIGPGETQEINFNLDESVADAEIVDGPAFRIDPGNQIELTLRATNIDSYTLDVQGKTIAGEPINESSLTPHFNGEEISFNESTDVDVGQHEEEELRITIDTDEDLISGVQLIHTFTGDNSETTLESPETTVQPETLHIPNDHDPDSLQDVIDFTARDTTIALDSDTTFEETITGTTALEIDKSITFRGDGGQANISISEIPDNRETVGILAEGLNTTISSISLEGSPDIGIKASELGVTVQNSHIEGPHTGTVMDDGHAITGTHYQSVNKAITVDRSVNHITNIEATAEETGIEINSEVGTVEDITISSNEQLKTGIEISGTTVEEFATANITAAETGILADESMNLIIEESNLTDVQNGVKITESTNVDLDRLEIAADATSLTIADGTTGLNMQDSTISGGGILFEDVTKGDNQVQTEYVDRSLILTGSQMELSSSTEPAPFPEYGSLDIFYETEQQSSSGQMSITVGYNREDVLGAKNATVQFYRFDPSTDSWTPISESSVDEVEQTISGTISESGTVGAFGKGVPYMAITDLVAPDEVGQGHTYTIYPTIENQGGSTYTDSVEFIFGDNLSPVADRRVTLDPGEQTILPLSYLIPSDLDDGQYDYSVNTVNESVTQTVTTSSNLDPANISIDQVSVNEINHETNDEVIVSITLRNSGGAQGGILLELTANNNPVTAKAALVDAQQSKTVELTHRFEHAGPYDLAVNGQSVDRIYIYEPSGVSVTETESVTRLIAVLLIIAILIGIIATVVHIQSGKENISATNTGHRSK